MNIMFTAWAALLVVYGGLDFAHCDWPVRGSEWQVPHRNEGCRGVAFLGSIRGDVPELAEVKVVP